MPSQRRGLTFRSRSWSNGHVGFLAVYKRRESAMSLVALIVAVFVGPLLVPNESSPWWLETLAFLDVFFATIVCLAFAVAAWEQLAQEKRGTRHTSEDPREH